MPGMLYFALTTPSNKFKPVSPVLVNVYRAVPRRCALKIRYRLVWDA